MPPGDGAAETWGAAIRTRDADRRMGLPREKREIGPSVGRHDPGMCECGCRHPQADDHSLIRLYAARLNAHSMAAQSADAHRWEAAVHANGEPKAGC